MDFKDRMIEAVERGFATEVTAYEYVRDSLADSADQQRKTTKETCPECGQPDNCGDCDHTPLFMAGDRVVWIDRDDEMGEWTGTVTVAKVFEPEVFVKLDVGGTFRVPRTDLRRA